MKIELCYKRENNGDRKFYLKNGELTAYSFACGYIQRAVIGGANRVQLDFWHEGACYHVRGHKYGEGRMFWDSYDTLGEARKAFRSKLKELAA